MEKFTYRTVGRISLFVCRFILSPVRFTYPAVVFGVCLLTSLRRTRCLIILATRAALWPVGDRHLQVLGMIHSKTTWRTGFLQNTDTPNGSVPRVLWYPPHWFVLDHLGFFTWELVNSCQFIYWLFGEPLLYISLIGNPYTILSKLTCWLQPSCTKTNITLPAQSLQRSHRIHPEIRPPREYLPTFDCRYISATLILYHWNYLILRTESCSTHLHTYIFTIIYICLQIYTYIISIYTTHCRYCTPIQDSLTILGGSPNPDNSV